MVIWFIHLLAESSFLHFPAMALSHKSSDHICVGLFWTFSCVPVVCLSILLGLSHTLQLYNKSWDQILFLKKTQEFLGGKWVKELAWSLLWLRLLPWCRFNLHTWEHLDAVNAAKKKKKNSQPTLWSKRKFFQWIKAKIWHQNVWDVPREFYSHKST